MSTTANFILDTRNLSKRKNKYPYKLRIVSNRRYKDYATIYYLDTVEYDKLKAANQLPYLKEIKNISLDTVTSANQFIKEMIDFSFEEFYRLFVKPRLIFKKNNRKENFPTEQCNEFDFSGFEKKFPILNVVPATKENISFVYIDYIKRLIVQDRIGNALNYQESFNSLKKFKGDAKFQQINISFLLQYEKWMKEKGCQQSTIGIKLRPLRAMFNEAHEMKIINKSNCYPFGRRRYKIPKSRNIKKSLTNEELYKILEYKTDCEKLSIAKDYWVFMYFGNGMNPKDLCLLRYENINEDFIIFNRAKSEKTSEDSKQIYVHLNKYLIAIISRRGNKNANSKNFIFPILNHSKNSLDIHFEIKYFIKYVNDGMQKIGEELKIAKKMTTIVARHTFSTQLKRAGVHTSFIQNSLGHSAITTTENYLDAFDDKTKREFSKYLLPNSNETFVE